MLTIKTVYCGHCINKGNKQIQQGFIACISMAQLEIMVVFVHEGSKIIFILFVVSPKGLWKTKLDWLSGRAETKEEDLMFWASSSASFYVTKFETLALLFAEPTQFWQILSIIL